MAFSSDNDTGGLMAEINVTPLVDVMLVLLIIFIITAPLMQHKIKVELPKANLNEQPKPSGPKTAPITITVKEDGSLFYNDEAITKEILESRLSSAAQLTPQPSLNLRGDRTTKMRTINDVTKIAQEQGMLDVGFIATKDRGN